MHRPITLNIKLETCSLHEATCGSATPGNFTSTALGKCRWRQVHWNPHKGCTVIGLRGRPCITLLNFIHARGHLTRGKEFRIIFPAKEICNRLGLFITNFFSLILSLSALILINYVFSLGKILCEVRKIFALLCKYSWNFWFLSGHVIDSETLFYGRYC